MARRRLTRKEIKQPDQFISSSARLFDWTKTHQQQLLYGVLGILIIIALTVGWLLWRRQRLQKAEVLLYEAVKLLSTETDASPDDKPGEPARLDRAMQELLSLTHDYSGTQVASLAYWYLGHLYFERGDYAAALTAYEQARQGIGQNHRRLIPALVALNIGYAQEAGGDCAQALASFEEVLQSSEVWLHGEAYLGMGRCYESTGATDKAVAVYARALSDVEISGAVRQSIEERQAQLQAAAKKTSVDAPAQDKVAPPQENK